MSPEQVRDARCEISSRGRCCQTTSVVRGIQATVFEELELARHPTQVLHRASCLQSNRFMIFREDSTVPASTGAVHRVQMSRRSARMVSSDAEPLVAIVPPPTQPV